MILRLAHVEITARDLAAARAFYVDLLGFVEHAAGDGDVLYLRGAEEFDVWTLKVTAGTGGGLVHSGFRVSDPADLDTIEQAQRARGLAAWRVAAGREPGQGEAVRTVTPEGHRIEFFHDFDEIDVMHADGRLVLPMRRAHELGGVPPARIDHVSMRVPDMDGALGFWVDGLDFSASEFWIGADGVTPHVAWLRRQPRSHDVALGASPAAAFHHFAFAVSDAAALTRAADLLADSGRHDAIEWGPSRHGATNAFAIYVADPSGNRLELYAGDYVRDLDRPPLRWPPAHYAQQGHSWWGDPPPESFGATQPLVGEWADA